MILFSDSPQIGQVYNVHSPARIPYHHPTRYYDQEPPPAHRPLTSHGSLAALGSDRGLAHMAPIGTPDRPLSSHSAIGAQIGGLALADRPISTHVDRPLSALGLMGAGLGAAGNLMGAVARHIGADAPTSQRGLQAATPPHASQVPPQAESLLMLLKVSIAILIVKFESCSTPLVKEGGDISIRWFVIIYLSLFT